MSGISPELTIGISAILVPLGACIVAYIFRMLQALSDRLTRVETKMEPFWSMIETQLPMMIKGKSGRRDVLLVKMAHKALSVPETWELIDLLYDDINAEVDIGKKLATMLVITSLKDKVYGMVRQDA